MGEFPQGAAAQATPDHQKQHLDPNTSLKTEYMSFPPPLQRSPLNSATDRGYVLFFPFVFILFNIAVHTAYLFPMWPPPPRPTGWLNTSYANNTVLHHPSKTVEESPTSSPTLAHRRSRPQDFDRASQESFSSMPDPADPTTITKTFKAGRKASAQANLASRSKTPSKSRRRRSKGHNKNSEGIEVEFNQHVLLVSQM